MIALTLLTLAAVTGLMALSAVVVREPGFATVNPFAAPPQADPAADTVAAGPTDNTLAGDWNRAELTSLSDAEELLDYLEATDAADRTLEILGNSTFVVRWR